ncbi:MAG: hypothetical protein KME04_12905 [Pleurocapsa minor GSE-CHR-MK-17-07R]|jgi:hypothetical protein|nr:hypothetical protein [Pleurocapsa minor GSE-CHR-MK 17-07R]
MRRLFAFVLLLCLLPLAGVVGQSVETITINGGATGVVGAGNTAPSFFFEATAGQVLTVRLETSTDGFNPVMLLADAANAVVSTFSGPPGQKVIGGTFTIATSGRYFVQIQGAGGTTGAFNLTLLEGEQPPQPPTPTALPLPTDMPTPLPEAVTAQGAENTGLSPLIIGGQTVTGGVSADTPVQSYRILGAVTEQVLDVRHTSEGRFDFSLFAGDDETPLATIDGTLTRSALVIPAGDGEYRLLIRHAGVAFVADYAISLTTLAEGSLIAGVSAQGAPPVSAPPTSLPTAGPSATPTAIPPTSVDLLLTWSFDQFIAVNVSGQPLDISTISFAGDNRRVDTSYWQRANGGLSLAAFSPGACVGLRPLAYQDPPTLPGNCRSLGGYWSADAVVFWMGDSFQVLFNGVPLVTCPSEVGTCGVDVP